MATGRMLKKNISTSKRLSELKTNSARLLYTWLLPHLDVEGRFSANSFVVKGYIVPRIEMITPELIEEYLKDMAKVDLIILYEVDGDRFLQFRKFENHQTLRKDREAGSEIPEPFNGAKVLNPELVGSNSRVSTGKDKISKDKLITEQSSEEHSKKKSPQVLVGNKMTLKKADSDVAWDTHAKIFQYINELDEKGEKISTDGSKKFKILAYYIILDNSKIVNKLQWNSFVKRNIRVVGRLVEQGWTCEKICLTGFLLEAKKLSFTLETIEKWLPKLDKELSKQTPEEEEIYKDLYQELKNNISKLNKLYANRNI